MKYFLIIVAALCVITLVNILLESHRENKKISFSSYRIKDKRLKKNAKIVMISDLHNACYGEKNSELLHVVETISPDLILVAGDVIVGKTGLSVDTGVDFLNSLGESFPVFVGKGNHEMRTSIYEKYGDMWETLYERTKDKVHWLINDSIYLADYNMTIYGLDMKPEYYRRFKKLYMDSAYLEEELRKPDKRSYNILIGHDPDYFEEYAAWGADLCVSGHYLIPAYRIYFLQHQSFQSELLLQQNHPVGAVTRQLQISYLNLLSENFVLHQIFSQIQPFQSRFLHQISVFQNLIYHCHLIHFCRLIY